jgi:hypothetical protein
VRRQRTKTRIETSELATESNPVRWPQFFRASAFWSANLIAAPIVGIGGFTLILVGNISREDSPGSLVLSLLAVYAVATILAYFPGNLSVLWPYAIQVDPLAGVQLWGPLKKIAIPISEIGEIEESLLWQGYVIHLTRRRVALTQFVVPWYFGSQRKDVVRAIRLAKERMI